MPWRGWLWLHTQATVSTASKSEITLRGSVKIVTEFFAFAINRSVRRLGRPPRRYSLLSPSYITAVVLLSALSLVVACAVRRGSILYQRAIYPAEAFTSTTQYGLSMMVTTDEGLKHYLTQVLTQLSGM